jgi:hypothetical protein
MKGKSFAVVLILLGGCAARPPIVIEEYYEPPSDGPTATIVGEESVNSLVPFIFDNNTIFVNRVGYLVVRDAPSTGKIPLTIAAGKQRVVVAQRLGSLSGYCLLDFEAKAGVAYRVRYERDLEGTNFFNRTPGQAGGPTFFWIEELESGKPVTEKARGYVGSDPRAPIPIPIFIPRSR